MRRDGPPGTGAEFREKRHHERFSPRREIISYSGCAWQLTMDDYIQSNTWRYRWLVNELNDDIDQPGDDSAREQHRVRQGKKPRRIKRSCSMPGTKSRPI
jgi:hypothetical protein